VGSKDTIVSIQTRLQVRSTGGSHSGKQGYYSQHTDYATSQKYRGFTQWEARIL